MTGSPRFRLQPYDYDGGVYIGPPEQKPVFPEEKVYDEEDEEEEEEDDTGNQLEGEELNPRGDAFCEWRTKNTPLYTDDPRRPI